MIAVTFLVAISLVFSNLRSDRADLREFVDLAEVTALEQDALASEFRNFLSFGVRSADRDTISALFGSIESSIRRSLDDLSVLEVPASGAKSEALLNEALEAWLAGSFALETGLLAAADEPASPIPVIGIDAALTEIRVGDRLYERFVLSVGQLRTELESVIGVMPIVAYAPLNGLVMTGEALAESVRGAGEVAAFHDVRIGRIKLDPDFTGGESDGAGVLAFTESISTAIVISNAGNLPESELTVVAKVSTVADGATLFNEQTTIVSLDPGASRTVEFLDIPVLEGVTHEVLVIVTAVMGDIDTSNNTATLRFFVQAAS